LPRIAATLNKVLKSDRPRRGIARAFLFPERAAMRASVTVRVAGSTSNLGAGFDCIGVAVGRWLRVEARVRPGSSVAIERAGTLTALETPPEHDLLYRGFAAVCRHAGRDVPAGLALTADSDIPVARGLGSSAAATVAGAAAAAALLEFELDGGTLAELASELEGHPDNVAPAVFGGANLVLRERDGLVVTPLPIHPSLALVFAVPDFTVETKRARAALPATLPHADAVRAAGKSAALVHGLAHADPRLLAAGLDDVLHVPFRRSLIDGYDSVCSAAVGAGAFGATLSGSGSTLVAVAPERQAPAVAEAMRSTWEQHGVQADSFVNPSQVDGRSLTVHLDCEDAPATAAAAC
jgi:homoserine kinase